MIRVNQLKLPVEHTQETLLKKLAHALRISEDKIQRYQIIKQSIDARKKPQLFYSYTVDVKVDRVLEKRILKKSYNKNIMLSNRVNYQFPPVYEGERKMRPVVVGSGPAGLFCAWMLAKSNLAPIVLERGEAVDARHETVERFWESGILNPESNVQFGEGGAGTFSDGKLNTSVKDPKGRNFQVLRMFVDAGAPGEILYQQKPHLGTDQLMIIVKNLRRQIEDMGGSFRFNACMTDIQSDAKGICAIEINGEEWIDARIVVCALGHSARDTFEMLYKHGIRMEAKAFAAGIRIEHPQSMINLSQYGMEDAGALGAAPYKLTCQTKGGRGVYSFCMCPGGYVVNASSEAGYLAINGMSYQDRGSSNANSALIVTVTPDDFSDYACPETPEPLRGIDFQRVLEKRAFEARKGAVPIQLLEDFLSGRKSVSFGDVKPCIKGAYALGNLHAILPEFMTEALGDAVISFGRKIPGFDRGDCLLSAVESRSSSPIRIVRDETMQSSLAGLYPCGEGAGYAGGITSAAMDGLKTAEVIAASVFL